MERAVVAGPGHLLQHLAHEKVAGGVDVGVLFCRDLEPALETLAFADPVEGLNPPVSRSHRRIASAIQHIRQVWHDEGHIAHGKISTSMIAHGKISTSMIAWAFLRGDAGRVLGAMWC